MDFWQKMLFPHFCLRCKAEGTLWCQSCQETYCPEPPKPACPFCHALGSDRTCDHCQKETALDGLSAFSVYGDPVVREAIQQWKYIGDKTAFAVLQTWMTSKKMRLQIPLSATAVIPIPLHIRRKRFRGFDQAQLFGDFFAKQIGVPCLPLLKRIKRHAPQAMRAQEKRSFKDLEGIFFTELPVPDVVLLCDDVFTSGATMNAAAQCLKEHGAKVVWGVVLAKGG
ncbi:MAG: Amidophosphoribosyltransferase family protein [Candidatus Uhrbacteria bacterium GW2011_GWE2_40_58]|nr:MAG: Amidophosphoribosyltransferase family protein [Candidatus Uhrbacteria bacterium GW2011_GWF2_40_263]KKR68163.1 MAG: Amidophosphoribosyltransferase family protein [Candidatus Uhrbacteria bacterium GW2011_GWE2_40_58]OGL91851.1 MAG: hypothetical protein A2239_01515 [Candidatus Uhrbacteria bacterium RIFOXYA2_FULL_40_9]OGL97680.1 MAG: hypothetical protein A2332_00845 [Candidatus Uhrbacteria bacterium RIFOXYB2_FULL_41_18]HBK34694.1 hypothetical protein [Candidatus Uhrbacteria bacterium]